jgi:hypothetical protein
MKSAEASTASSALVRAIADGPVTDLTSAVAVLDQVDPALLESMDRVDLVRAVDRCEAALAALKVRAIAAVADSYQDLGMPASEARHEIGAALRLSPVTAADRTAVAVDLRDRFPRTLALLDEARICWLQAANLARGTDDLIDETAALVEEAVLARMPRQTPAETRRAVADAVVKLDPAAAAERAERKKAERRIDRVPDRDGRTGWFLPMSVAEEGDAWGRATELAKKVRAARTAAGLESPGLDALRVDVTIDVLLGRDPLRDVTADPGSTSSTSSTGTSLARCSCGGKQTAAVVIDVGTLLGLADNPGRVPGYGLVPADLARAMAADRDLVRWLVAPDTGELLDVGADTYRPSDRLARFIRARDQRCGFPGCSRPAVSCQLDHVRPFSFITRGGKTIRVNLGPLCQQHHNAKTHGGWTLTSDPTTRTKQWSSPLGKAYVTDAVPLRT